MTGVSAETIEREGGREKEMGFGTAQLPLNQKRVFALLFLCLSHLAKQIRYCVERRLSISVRTAFPISFLWGLRHCMFFVFVLF